MSEGESGGEEGSEVAGARSGKTIWALVRILVFILREVGIILLFLL